MGGWLLEQRDPSRDTPAPTPVLGVSLVMATAAIWQKNVCDLERIFLERPLPPPLAAGLLPLTVI